MFVCWVCALDQRRRPGFRRTIEWSSSRYCPSIFLEVSLHTQTFASIFLGCIDPFHGGSFSFECENVTITELHQSGFLRCALIESTFYYLLIMFSSSHVFSRLSIRALVSSRQPPPPPPRFTSFSLKGHLLHTYCRKEKHAYFILISSTLKHHNSFLPPST